MGFGIAKFSSNASSFQCLLLESYRLFQFVWETELGGFALEDRWHVVLNAFFQVLTREEAVLFSWAICWMLFSPFSALVATGGLDFGVIHPYQTR